MKKIKTLFFVLQFYSLYVYTKILVLVYSIIGNKTPKKDVLFLECFPEDGAGYTYRVKHWMNLLLQDGFKVESKFIIRFAKEFFRESSSENLQRFLIKSIVIRIKQINYSRNFKVVVVRRNLLNYNQYGNHFMEKLLAAAHPNRILDFDDDIGATVAYDGRKRLFHKLLMTSQDHFYSSFHFYNGFITGSSYLKQLLKSKHKDLKDEYVQVIPTCVNYTDVPCKNFEDQPILTFGWIGGTQNLNLLKKIVPALNKIYEYAQIQLIVMAGVDNFDLGATFPVHFEIYSLETEIDFLKRIDIGLMPLNDNMIDKGKCGFKLLQYMGVGVPGIASAITVNNEIIEQDVNGWLVKNDDDWEPVLKQAILKKNELSRYGANARKTVEERYTFKSNYQFYKKFITQFAGNY
jgi:glycosyltransferase involved in cell wall biosynthesis